MAPRSLPTRVARRVRFSAESEAAARALLGRRHPLTRALSLQRTLVSQILVTAVVVALGVAGLLSRGADAVVVLGAATVVGAGLLAFFLLTRGLVRDRSDALIAAGFDTPGIPVLARERERLASRSERERLARALERYVAEAEAPGRVHMVRPIVELRCVRLVAPEARETARLLRSESANVRGVAAVARFLVDGCESSLFRGDADVLRRDLRRLHWLLAPGSQSEQAQAPERRAA